jgi:hypothetical protein
MTMKRDFLVVLGGFIPILLVPLLPQRFWIWAIVLLIVLAMAISAILIPGLGEMERAREGRTRTKTRTKTSGAILFGTAREFWVADQSFRNQ